MSGTQRLTGAQVEELAIVFVTSTSVARAGFQWILAKVTRASFDSTSSAVIGSLGY
jgi:hypothetical protein